MGDRSGAPTRRPPISLYTIIPSTGNYTYGVGVWDLSIVQGPFSVGRAKPPIVRFATFAGTTIRPLWGTAQLFKHQRFMNGGATSPQAEVYAFAAAQVGVKWKAEVESTTLYAGCVS